MRAAHTLAIVLINAGLASCGADAPSATSQGEGRADTEMVHASPWPPVSHPEPAFSSEHDGAEIVRIAMISSEATSPALASPSEAASATSSLEPGFLDRVARAAEARTRVRVVYDPAYVRLDYPMGDVADDRGVCIDVVIRAYRAVGVDLQVEIHEDMARAFSAYPNLWGLSGTDRNIDHRRVPNLETYLARQGAELTASEAFEDYLPGDIVTYRLPGNLPHAAVVSSRRARDGAPLIVHNIGLGPRLENRIFEWPVHRHFRWTGPENG